MKRRYSTCDSLIPAAGYDTYDLAASKLTPGSDPFRAAALKRASDTSPAQDAQARLAALKRGAAERG